LLICDDFNGKVKKEKIRENLSLLIKKFIPFNFRIIE